jgi:hypothetical protein
MLKIGHDFECTGCRNVSLVKKVNLERGDVILCKFCGRLTVILDCSLANPEKLDTAGLTKQISFVDSRAKQRLIGYINPFTNKIDNTNLIEAFIVKYNMDHPDDLILK